MGDKGFYPWAGILSPLHGTLSTADEVSFNCPLSRGSGWRGKLCSVSPDTI